MYLHPSWKKCKILEYQIVRPSSSTRKQREACFQVLPLLRQLTMRSKLNFRGHLRSIKISQAYFGGCDLPEKNKRCNMKYNFFKGIELNKIFFIYCDQASFLTVIPKIQCFPKYALIITSLTMGYLILKVHYPLYL